MPVAEKSIIAPGSVDARQPLKKTTVAWILGVLLALAIIGYAVPHMMKLNMAAEDQTVEKRRTTGTESQIDEETRALRKAADKVAAERAAADRAAALQTAASAPVPTPMPADTSSGARTAAGASVSASQNPAVDEIDAGARTSRSVMLDNTAGMFGQDQTSGSDKKAAREAAIEAQLPRSAGTDPNASDPTDRVSQLIRAQAAGQAPRDYDRDWLKEYSELKPTRAITPMRVKNPFTLIQGKVIPAVLGKSLNSDLPGDITAFTTMDVYDSLSGRNLLVPKGSMLVGEYSNRVRPGQDRMMFAFSRIVLPNGLSFDLPGNKGEDQTGASGITGDVDNHYFKRFTSGILIALLADKLESGNTQPVTNIGTATSGPNTAAGKVLSEIASADLGRNKDIPPTITIPKGTRINVQVSADMEFPSPYINRSKL